MEDAKVKKALGATRFLEEVLREMHAEADGDFTDACEAAVELRELIEGYVKQKLFAQWMGSE